MPRCAECEDTGIILAEAQRVRWGRQGRTYVAVLPGEPTVIPNRCFVCGQPPIDKVFRVRP